MIVLIFVVQKKMFRINLTKIETDYGKYIKNTRGT